MKAPSDLFPLFNAGFVSVNLRFSLESLTLLYLLFAKTEAERERIMKLAQSKGLSELRIQRLPLERELRENEKE